MTSLCPLNSFSAGKVLLSSGGTFLLLRCHLYVGVTNISLPEDFDKKLSTMRSRNVFVSIILQNIAQLKALFEKQWESILGNCDELLYLGGNEQGSHKYISELLGKATIDTNTYGRSSGRNGNYSTNYQITGRELMTPDEVRMLDNGKALLFIRGELPVCDDKFDIMTHPLVSHTPDGGARKRRVRHCSDHHSRPASANGSRGSSKRKRNPIRAPFQRGIGGNL